MPVECTDEDEEPADEPDEDHALTVHVEPGGGDPIPEATVELAEVEGTEREIGSDGTVTFDVPDGEYSVHAVATGYEPREEGVIVDAEDGEVALREDENHEEVADNRTDEEGD